MERGLLAYQRDPVLLLDLDLSQHVVPERVWSLLSWCLWTHWSYWSCCHHNIHSGNPWSCIFNFNAGLATHSVFFVLTLFFCWKTETQGRHNPFPLSQTQHSVFTWKKKLLTILKATQCLWVIWIPTLD